LGVAHNLDEACKLLEVGFEYRSIKGKDVFERDIAWTAGPMKRVSAAGPFNVAIPGMNPNDEYEYRAVVQHPLLRLFGGERRVSTR
jgi:hypothetical protein